MFYIGSFLIPVSGAAAGIAKAASRVGKAAAELLTRSGRWGWCHSGPGDAPGPLRGGSAPLRVGHRPVVYAALARCVS